jgi:hypothetical protein
VAIVVDRAAVERRHGDHRNLGGGLALDVLDDAFNRGNLLGIEQIR